MAAATDKESLQRISKQGDVILSLGELAVKLRMLGAAQRDEALAVYIRRREQGERIRFGEVLVDCGMLSHEQLNTLISAQKMRTIVEADRTFGKIVVANNFATQEQVDGARESQKQAFLERRERKKIGEIMLDRGDLEHEQHATVLSIQQRLQAEASPLTAESMIVHEAPDADLPEEAPVEMPEQDLAPGFVLKVSRDHLSATIRMLGELGEQHTLEAIQELLQEQGVVFGVRDEAAISDYLAGLQAGGEEAAEPWTIAEGEAPVQGNDGLIEYRFNTDPMQVGQVSENGVIDYKDRGEIPQVDAGEVLAEKGPAQASVAGMDVFGHELPAAPPRTIKISCGEGASLSADGRQAIADEQGLPVLGRKDQLSVFPVYVIDGDVGYKTGHVDFHGEVRVSGGVDSDFRVHAGRLIAGELRAAEIEVEGDVVVLGGIIGAQIRCGGNLKARYIHKGQVEAGGDIMVEREIMDSELHTGGALHAKQAVLLSSRVSSCGPMTVRDIGAEGSINSTIYLGTCDQLAREINHLGLRLEALREERKPLQGEDPEFAAEKARIEKAIGEKAQVQDRTQLEQRQLEAMRSSLEDAEALRELEAEQATLEEQVKAVEAELNALFAEQDELYRREDERHARDEALAAECEALEEEERTLLEQKEQRQGEATLTVLGTMQPMTKVAGIHTSARNKEPVKGVQLTEKQKYRPNGEVVWAMVSRKNKGKH